MTYRLGSLAILLACASGCCARWQDIPDDCVGALYECDFARLAHNLCTSGESLSCADPIVDGDLIEEEVVEVVKAVEVEEVCEPACPPALLAKCVLARRKRVVSGPPPVPYQPPMPPKFLAVPTGPVYTEVSPDAPRSERGSVEVGYGPQLAFPGRD